MLPLIALVLILRTCPDVARGISSTRVGANLVAFRLVEAYCLRHLHFCCHSTTHAMNVFVQNRPIGFKPNRISTQSCPLTSQRLASNNSRSTFAPFTSIRPPIVISPPADTSILQSRPDDQHPREEFYGRDSGMNIETPLPPRVVKSLCSSRMVLGKPCFFILSAPKLVRRSCCPAICSRLFAFLSPTFCTYRQRCDCHAAPHFDQSKPRHIHYYRAVQNPKSRIPQSRRPHSGRLRRPSLITAIYLAVREETPPDSPRR